MDLISIDKINTNNKYLRLDTDVESLCKSLETIGLIHPVTVDKEFRLLAGGRRYSAAKQLGWTEIAVEVVDKNELVHELISIDENLVRKPLKNLELEKCLNRGRDIYEQLNPDANKVNIEVKTLTPAEKREEKQADEEDETSFVAITAEKTGLSKSSIKSAIKRDELSSPAVKTAREEGKLNASQTNELIRLNKDEQERILPVIQGKTAKDIKKIVATVKVDGVDEALTVAGEMVPLPREYKELKAAIGKMNKLLSKILIENIEYSGPEQSLIWREMRKLQDRMDSFFEDQGSESEEYMDKEEAASFQ